MAETEASFLESVRDKAIHRGGEVYFRSDQIQEILQRSAHYNLAVVGLEAFELDADGLHLRLDLIADYSRATASDWNSFRQRCLSLALEWIAHLDRSASLLVRPTFLDESEW
jgi:hypothetical protein